MFSTEIFTLRNILHSRRLLLKLLVIFLSITLCVILYFSYTLPTKPITLTLLVQALEAPEWKILVKDFEKEYEKKNIHIEIVEGSDATDALESAYIKDFESSKYYDLVYTDIIWTARFAHEGWLTDLSKLFEEEVDEFLPFEVESGHYDEKLYRLPFHSDVGVLFYRKDLLDRIGRKPPVTFDELADVFKELKELQEEKPQEVKIPQWGYVWQGQKYEGLVAMFIEILYGYGGYWIQEQSDVGLDKEPALKAVKFLRNTIYDKEPISPPSVAAFQETETRKVFEYGDTVFLRNWPFVWSYVNSPDSPIRGKVGITQMVHAKNLESSPCRGGWGLGISKFTKHPKEAEIAIRFLTSANSQRIHALRTGNLPTRRSLFYDPLLVEKYNYFPELLKILDKSVTRPSTPKYNEISKILQEYLYKTLKQKNLSDEDISKIMEDAARDTRDCLNKVNSSHNERSAEGLAGNNFDISLSKLPF